MVSRFGSASAIPTQRGAVRMSDKGCILLLGDFSSERPDFASLARHFGWSVCLAGDLAELREAGRSNSVMAVLVQSGALALPWPQALRTVRAFVPRAPIILCHKAEKAHARSEMVEAGAFGSLLSPLAQSEVRQLLGFVWASRTSGKPIRNADLTAGQVRRAGAA